jgi:hypothetical protein
MRRFLEKLANLEYSLNRQQGVLSWKMMIRHHYKVQLTLRQAQGRLWVRGAFYEHFPGFRFFPFRGRVHAPTHRD